MELNIQVALNKLWFLFFFSLFKIQHYTLLYIIFLFIVRIQIAEREQTEKRMRRKKPTNSLKRLKKIHHYLSTFPIAIIQHIPNFGIKRIIKAIEYIDIVLYNICCASLILAGSIISHIKVSILAIYYLIYLIYYKIRGVFNRIGQRYSNIYDYYEIFTDICYELKMLFWEVLYKTWESFYVISTTILLIIFYIFFYPLYFIWLVIKFIYSWTLGPIVNLIWRFLNRIYREIRYFYYRFSDWISDYWFVFSNRAYRRIYGHNRPGWRRGLFF